MKAIALLVCGLCACGGSTKHTAGLGGGGPALVASVESLAFYKSRSSCAQGPFELELPLVGSRYGEAVELLVTTPRRIEVHAEIAAGSESLAAVEGTFDPGGRAPTDARPDNARCLADVRARLSAARGGGGSTGPGASGTTGGDGAATAGQISVAAVLDRVSVHVLRPTPLVTVRIPDSARAQGRVRIRLWSIEPNDLEGVVFGVTHVAWRPNVPEAEYEAHLARIEAERLEAVRADEEEARARAARARVTISGSPAPARAIDPEEQRRRERAEAERIEREHRQAAERRARDERARIAAEQARLTAEQARLAREQYCATHPDDRDCWGPGGLRIHLELQARAQERDAYCAAHREDARCWTAADRDRIHADEQRRVELALNPPKPSGPPPDPLAETMPPRLSMNAEWRPGYWQWIDATWVWLAGQWRVPEADVLAEQTTTAPIAPPPMKLETPPPPPVATVIWVPGFWQWDSRSWIWVGGSYQLRPTATLTWRAAAWRPRGSLHVLVPGAWIRGGSR